MGCSPSARQVVCGCFGPAGPFLARGPAGAQREPCGGGPSAATPARAQTPADLELDGHKVLEAVLEVARRCQDGGAPEGAPPEAQALADGALEAECLLSEPDKRYFLCSSLDSTSVTVYFWLRLDDVRLADVRRALVDRELRVARDPDIEYTVHRGAAADDPTMQEDFSCVMRAPWPFSDRESLLRRWQLPLPAEGGACAGLAVVMRSFEDPELLPPREDRVRSFVSKSANLLRPISQDSEVGLDVSTCQQIDLGGLCPAWAQRFLTRFAVSRAIQWGEQIRSQCRLLEEARQGVPRAGPAAVPPPVEESARAAESVDRLERSRSRDQEPMSGEEVLSSILAIERLCSEAICEGPGAGCGESSGEPRASRSCGELSVECLLNEPSEKICLCASLGSPIVIGYMRVRLFGVFLRDVLHALVDKEERLARDPDSEYRVLRPAPGGDPTLEEDISFVYRAPWPFWDRDVLQRRWTFPLGGEGSGCVALVMRSFHDGLLLPEREDRVRAFVHKCGYLLRPDRDGGSLEIAVCHQVDIGGICPEWAQDMLTRWTVHRGSQWATDLREHCLERARQRPACRQNTASSVPSESDGAWGCAVS